MKIAALLVLAVSMVVGVIGAVTAYSPRLDDGVVGLHLNAPAGLRAPATAPSTAPSSAPTEPGPIAQRGLVLLAVYLICLAVPAVVFLDVAQQAFARGGAGWWVVLASRPSVAMPLRLWRGDMVMLSLAGLLILPAALGRWRLGKLEGGALIGLYIVYVALALWSRR